MEFEFSHLNGPNNTPHPTDEYTEISRKESEVLPSWQASMARNDIESKSIHLRSNATHYLNNERSRPKTQLHQRQPQAGRLEQQSLWAIPVLDRSSAQGRSAGTQRHEFGNRRL